MDTLKKYLSDNKITQAQFAQMLGIKTQSAISQWFSRNQVPAERVIQIERLTGKKVTRYVLRPDLYPMD